MPQLNDKLELDDFFKILFKGEKITLHPETGERLDEGFSFLKKFAKDKIIYGVNTGFGPMAQYRIDEEDEIQLQYNLIRSHASGTGKSLEGIYVKSLMLARLNTLLLGKSGVHKSVPETMLHLINKNIYPVVFEHGGVGASGDLVQLAHLALTLIGEGEVFYKGKRIPTQSAFEAENIQPIQIKLREGLALMNGTSAMTGIGIVNLIYARRLLNWSIYCSAAINEIVKSYDDHLSEELNAAKLHQGQQKVAAMMREHLSDGKLTRKREKHLYANGNKSKFFKEKIQEYYSLRCVPQILGPVWDTLETTERILMQEVNSANDNPIVDVDSAQVYHGGNFHGDYVSFEMDKLKLVMTKLSMLAERQLNYLLNPNLNDALPPFVNMGKLGLNFGLQGMQFTAVSTTAENQALSNSMYVHSIPSNNDNQDIVSMGTNSANIARTVIENAYEVVAIELIAIVQALYYMDCEENLSSATKSKLKKMKEFIPPFREDKQIYPYVHKMLQYIHDEDCYG